jgi:hypothetical protein
VIPRKTANPGFGLFEKSCYEDLLAAFFAGLYLAIFYTFNNLTLLRPEGIMVIFSLAILPVMALTFLIHSLFFLIGKKEKAQVVIVFVLSAFLLFMLNPALRGFELVRRFFEFFRTEYLLATFLFVFTLAVLLAFLFQKKTNVYSILLGLMSITALMMGISNTMIRTSPFIEKEGGEFQYQQVTLKQTPNIYFILSDGFGSFAFMEDQGIDVSGFSRRLAELDFRLYEDTYSNYQPTTSAMPAMLNMEHHYYTFNENRVHFSEVSTAARRVIGGDNNVSHVLRNNGYSIQYIHAGTYLLVQGCSADSCFPELDRLVGVKIILSHIFKSDLLSVEDKVSRKNSLEEVQSEVSRLMTGRESSPRFQYIHVYTPSHSPNKDFGRCDERVELRNYAKRLEHASAYMINQIEDILALDPEAVIVLAGDHGPFILNNCSPLGTIDTVEEYRDRAGILTAIRWPKSYRGEYDDRIVTGVNLFRFLLASLALDATPLLQSAVSDDVFIRDEALRSYMVIQGGKPLAESQPN